jgi:hypothetical protein
MKVPPFAPFHARQSETATNSKAHRNSKKRGRLVLEPIEPRLLLSADAVLGAGATTTIIDSFEEYGSVIQGHIDDASTDFDTLIPGILLTQRDTNNDNEVDDEDVTSPHMRDLLGVEIEHSSGTTTAELALQALDTDG